MMRSMNKRKFKDIDAILTSENQKKIKINDKKPLPIPENIKLGTGCIEYHFESESDAENFRQHLAFLESDLNEKILTDNVCVQLSERQFNVWLKNPDAFKDFCRIALMYDESQIVKINSIEMDENFRNQIALLSTDKTKKPLYLAMIDYPIVVSDFYAKLSTETLNTIVLQKDDKGANVLMLAAGRYYLNDLNHILDRLSDDVYNKAVLCKDESGNTLLSLIAKHCPYSLKSTEPHFIIQFLERLTPETLQSIILSSDEDKNSLLQLAFLDDAFYKTINTLFEYPESFKKLTEEQSMLRTLRLYDNGDSIDIWSTIAKHILFATPPVTKHPSRLSLSNELEEVKLPLKLSITTIQNICHDQWKFVRFQGRTILFENEDKNILALKIQKHAERMSDLSKEYKTTYFLNKNAEKLGLKSQFPIPRQLAIIKNAKCWINQNTVMDTESKEKILNMVGKDKLKHGVYVYEVETKKSDYFTYLHDSKLSVEKFNEANRIVVHDLFTLLQHGVIFSQLADIFHNLEHVDDRKDKGRYIVLVNLLRNFSRKGSGRLTDWIGSVQFPNVRESGLADLGDRITINDLIGLSERVEELYGEAWNMYRSKTCNYLLANIMAEYQYVLFLVAGRRGFFLTQKAKENKKSNDEIHTIWLDIAKQMVANCVDATALITNKRKETIEKIFISTVNVDRLARQMRYWMTDEYIEDLKNNRIRNGIYEKDTYVEVAIEKFRKGTFNDVYGCSIDGVNRDLGPVNGQEHIKEENKLLYWMINYIFTVYNQFRLTLKDLHHILKEENLIKSAEKRNKSFFYLPSKYYHAIHQAIFEEYLKQKEILEDEAIKNLYKKELEYHKKEKAAYTINDFWRKYKKPDNTVQEKKNTLILK